MSKAPGIYTATMAKVLEAQGNYLEAQRIYRHLLSVGPDRPEYLDALNRIESRLRPPSEKELIRLLEKWVDLLLMKRRIDRLEQLKKTAKEDK